MNDCWHCGGSGSCNCIACGDERGPGKCKVCAARGRKWFEHPVIERGNAPAHNRVMKLRRRRMMRLYGVS